MSTEWDPNIEADVFALNEFLIREYGILKVWEARNNPEKRIPLFRDWLTDSRREFQKWNDAFWYRQRRAGASDPHQSPLSISERDSDGMHGRIEDYPEIADYYERGRIKAVLQAAGCTSAEIEALTLRFDGKTEREVATERGVTPGTTHRTIASGIERLRSRFEGSSREVLVEGDVQNVA